MTPFRTVKATLPQESKAEPENIFKLAFESMDAAIREARQVREKAAALKRHVDGIGEETLPVR